MPTPPPGVTFEDDGGAPTPPPGVSFPEDDQGSPVLRAAGAAASLLPRAGRAAGVATERLLAEAPSGHTLATRLALGLTDPAAVEKARAAGAAAFKPGYQPKEGEKLGAALGGLAGSAPEIAAASAIAPTFVAPGMGLAATALARAAHSAVVFGALGGIDHAAEQAALTGKIDPMQGLKAAAGGALTGAALGAAGAVPALVSGQLPEAVTKVLSDEIASRIFGASVAGAVGAGASAAGGGTKEDVAAHGAGFFLMDILGNANFDAQYKEAAKNSAIKPLVDAMVGSGMDPKEAIPQARGMLEQVLKESGHASAVIKDSPQYAEAVRFMAGEYLKVNPGMDPVGAEALARRRLDVAFASGEMSIADLKKLKLSLTPAEAAPASAEAPPASPEAPTGLPTPEGSSAAPEPAQAAAQPNPGDRVIIPSEGGHVEGRVIGYDGESGHPRVEVTGAHGDAPPGAIGDVLTPVPESVHQEAAPESWDEAPPEDSGEESKLVRGPAQSIGQMTPDEFKTRFKGVPQAVYIKALTDQLEAGKPVPPEALDAHPELAEIAKEKSIKAQWQDLADQGIAGHEQPAMDLLRAAGGMDIATLKDSGDYGELRGQDLLNRGLARAGGPIKGWDHAAELLWQAGIIPEYDKNMAIDAVMSEGRKGTKGFLAADRYEEQFPEMFPPRAPKQEWLPERTQAAMDAAGVKPGGPVTSYGFIDADHGRFKRGEKGVLLGTDLENGRLLVDFGGKVSVVDPRDIKETYQADRDAEAPAGPPEGRAVKKAVEQGQEGLSDEEKTFHLAESEVLRIKLLNQQKGSIVGAQAARREVLGQMSQALRGGKDIRKTLAMFTKQAIADLKVNNVVAGKLLGIVASAKNEHDFTQALLNIEDTINGAYSKQLDDEIKQIWNRAQGSPGVEVGWQIQMREVFKDVRFTKPNAATLERGQAAAEFIAQAMQAGQSGQVNPGVRQMSEDALKRPLASLSIPEKEEIRDTMLSLEQVGRQAQKLKEHAQMYRRMRLVAQMTSTGQPIERSQPVQRRPGEAPLPINARIRNSIGTDTDFWQDKGRAILAPHVMFDMADGDRGYTGGHSLELEALNAAYHDATQFAHEILKPIHAIIEGQKITPEEYERTAIALIRNQPGGLEHLAGDRWLGKTPEERLKYAKSITLDHRQKQLAAELLRIGNDKALFKAIADDIRTRQNREVKKVDNWYPFVNNYSRFGDMPLNERVGDAYENRFARKEVAHGYTIERQAGAKTALRYDLSAFEKIVNDMAYQVKAGGAMQLFSEAVNSDQYERRMGPFWTKWMRSYATLVASRGGTQGARRSEMIQKVTRNMATFALGWRAASAFSHVGLLPLAANEIGWGPVMWGLQNYSTPEHSKFLRDNIPEFRESTRGAAALEAVRAPNQPGSARGEAFNVYDTARRMFAGSAALGAYKHWHDQRGFAVDWSKPNRNALLYAAAIMTRTQGSPLFKDVPMALSSGGMSGNVDLDRAILQFKQPILARWSYFLHDIKHLGWDAGNRSEAAAKFSNLMLGQMLEFGVKWAWKGMIGAIIGGIFGEAYAHRKEAPVWQRFAEHVAGTIPFVDNLMQMGLHERTGIPALDSIKAIPKGIVSMEKSIAAGRKATALHATVDALSGIAAIAAGAPGGSIAAEVAHKSISAFVANNKRSSKAPRPPRPPRISR